MTPVSGPPDEARSLAQQVARALDGTSRTVAAAESITSGNIAAALAAAPNAGQWFKGAVVAYAPEVKFSVLGVEPGPVITSGCARQMATGVSALLGADLSVGTSGAGGPGPEEDRPAGTVFIAVSTRDGSHAREYHFDGEPPDIVYQSTVQALRDLAAALAEQPAT